jgi:cell division protein FtsQ
VSRPTAGRRSRRGGPARDGAVDAASGWEHAGRGRAARLRAAGEAAGAAPAAGRTRDRARRPPPAGAPARGPGARPEGLGSSAARRPVPDRFRRRRLVAALGAALVLLVGVGLGTRVLLYDAGLADVEDVAVTGLSTVAEQAVRDAVAIAPGGPLIAVDTAGIVQRVAAVEGVADVAVRRAWPHTVEVAVTERVPVALWQTPEGLFEVDGSGLPYRRAPEPPPALPRLVFGGVAPQDPSTGAALAVLRDLADPLRARVATVEVAGAQVTLGLADGRAVRWGGPERAADKAAVVGALLEQPGTVYDVSSPDLPTVRP